MNNTQSISNCLRDLETDISHMAALVENQLLGAITAFERRDIIVAEKLIVGDLKVDEYFNQIDAGVLNVLAKGVSDETSLREIVTILKVNGELERVGDLAKNIAKRTMVVSREAVAPPNVGVTRMARASLRQFSDILNAYTTRDLDAAKAVWIGDDELDELYNSVFREIISAMTEDSTLVNACIHLVFIAKNLERVGDHATNLAEAIYFRATGTMMPDARPKSDETASAIVE